MGKFTYKKTVYLLISALTILAVFTGCGAEGRSASMISAVENASFEEMSLELINEAPGIAEERNENAVIDYSNISDGYVMVQYLKDTDKKIKAQVHGTEETYSYTLEPQKWTAFPLSEGNCDYRVSVFENVSGSKYAQVLSCTFSVELSDEFGPFLRPNQYVNYAEAPNTVATAKKLTEGMTETLDMVQAVYDFVTGTLRYDRELALNVTSGYVPNLDEDLAKKSGICFDYASLMTGMLRSRGVPCKMVFGYVDDTYHAWISVWVKGEGWIDNAIRFDGNQWTLLDPTYASANSAQATAQQVGGGEKYTAKFFY